ncbi:tetratricopeptide repeat protein [Maricaulis sp. D1M11]|uniref:tetratricopeptide repeat protein n=1 Tax=Maricaulis sp. D1M11 TaxID=3076117 RepID=UPI0039B4C0EE
MSALVLDLEAELIADAELQQNETRDAIGFGGGMKLDSQVKRLSKETQSRLKKVVAMTKRAMKASEEGDHAQGARLAHKALELAPDVALTNHVMGLMLFRLGRLSKSLPFFERAWQLDPQDPEIYQKLGLVAWKLDMLDGAEKFYRIQNQLAPDRVDGIINLSGVLRDQGKFEEAIELLRIAIYAHQGDFELWNSLGTVMMDSGDPEQAKTFYEEALRLKPEFSRAHNNMGSVYELLGEPEKALPHYEEALKAPVDETDRATMEHGKGLLLLAAGRVKEGWDQNEARLNPHRPDATLFTLEKPYWDGTDLAEIKDKNLLLIGEQGLGDEVLFMSIVPDLIDAVGTGTLTIACEYRLMDLVKRSFPEAEVCHHMSAALEGRDVRVAPAGEKNADIWTPMATPLRSLRQSLDDYPQDRVGFLKPDPLRQEVFRQQLAGFGEGLKVGILWKSLRMTPRRHRFFSAFDAWKPVLDLPGAQFINLQYGDVDEELAQAKDEFGITIHQPRDIDLKMDLDGVAALSSACDLILGPMNATTNLAAASGAEVWFIHARRTTWTLMGANRSYWYPQTRSFYGDKFQDWDTTMRRVTDALRTRIAETG